MAMMVTSLRKINSGALAEAVAAMLAGAIVPLAR
jgi:hypothetical protein